MLSKEIFSDLAVSKIVDLERLLTSVHLPEKLMPLYLYSIRGGRKFRSLLTIAGGNLIESNDSENLLFAAASIEMIHKASLIRDDIIDDDEFRRGQLTFHKKFSIKEGIMIGDLLVGLSFDFINKMKFDEPSAKYNCYNTVASVFSKLCIGQLKDFYSIDNANGLENANNINSEKTGSLIGTAMKIGCITGGGNKEQTQNAYFVGDLIGQLFQLMNDYNNLIGFEATNKREIYTDLFKNKSTTASVILFRHLSIEQALAINNDELDKDYLGQLINSKLPNIEKDIFEYANDKINEIEGLLKKFPNEEVCNKILAVANDFKEKWFWQNI